jgi:HNH endonuclease
MSEEYVGTRRRTAEGYILIKAPDHPCANHGWVSEHRMVAYEKYGDITGMDVHHINGIKDDNRPENLEVYAFGEHTKLHKTKVRP